MKLQLLQHSTVIVFAKSWATRNPFFISDLVHITCLMVLWRHSYSIDLPKILCNLLHHRGVIHPKPHGVSRSLKRVPSVSWLQEPLHSGIGGLPDKIRRISSRRKIHGKSESGGLIFFEGLSNRWGLYPINTHYIDIKGVSTQWNFINWI